jgi:hypothetical protein
LNERQYVAVVLLLTPLFVVDAFVVHKNAGAVKGYAERELSHSVISLQHSWQL